VRCEVLTAVSVESSTFRNATKFNVVEDYHGTSIKTLIKRNKKKHTNSTKITIEKRINQTS
jgi:hypothetical protein